LSRRNFSGDPLGDQKLQLERLIKKTQDALDGMRGIGLDAAESFSDLPQYATGYNGTETVVISIWDLSLWDAEDVWAD
jgi:hypothetical protein